MTAKTGLFAVTAAAAIVTFAAGWAVSGTQARIAGPTIDPLQRIHGRLVLQQVFQLARACAKRLVHAEQLRHLFVEIRSDALGQFDLGINRP